jgi:L-asparaginase/Glu-tRNA(Gln) amidotransferase subunit D
VGHRLKNTPGVLEAYDMTTEAVLAKLMWILGQTRDREEIQRSSIPRWPGISSGRRSADR